MEMKIFFITISYNNLLLIDKLQAMAADTGTIINPIPVEDKLKDVEVAPIITKLSTDLNIVVRVL